MVLSIHAPGIEDVLAPDELLVPHFEDLLLDALLQYRDTPKGIYEPQTQITTTDDLNIRIIIAPDIVRNGNHKNGRSETP